MDPDDTSYVDNFFLNNAWLDEDLFCSIVMKLLRQVLVLMTGGMEVETAAMRRIGASQI